MASDLEMNLGHQRTGCVEHAQAASRALFVHRAGYPVRAKNNGGAVRYLIKLIDEDRAARAQTLNDMAVVHHFMAHVDRRAEQHQCPLDDLDGAIDPGAEPAGIG
jgi:hypothetical protein